MNLPEVIYTVILKPRLLKKTANWMLKKIIPATVNVHGACIHVNPNDPVVSGALTLNLFEKNELAIFRQYFKSDMTLLDVGANVGLYSGIALATPDFCGKIICMEPHAESFSYLQKTIAANQKALAAQNIILSGMAASDIQGKAVLYSNLENKGDNRLYADDILTSSQEITVTTIDAVCQENTISTINFMKIDVQGAEAKAIKGAMSILSRSPDCIILSELWPYGLLQDGASLETYIADLTLLGFTLFKIEDNGTLVDFDMQAVAQTYTGRKYTNIMGFKGKYLAEMRLAKNG